LAQSAGDAVHTTDFLDERNNGTQQPQPQAATMSDADSANWNSWFIEAFDRRMGRVLEFIGDEVRKMDKQQADDLAARIDQLEERLDLLEDRIAELEGGNGNARRVMTQPRLQFRRHGDAA
jgi:uncharacterized coiled-coil protein SlyX